MPFEGGMVSHSSCILLCAFIGLSLTHSLIVLPGDINPQEMVPSRKNAVLVDGVVLNGPTIDVKAGEKFVEEACRLIMEEVVLKATDINEKVKRKQIPRMGKMGFIQIWMGRCKENGNHAFITCTPVFQVNAQTLKFLPTP